MYPYVKTGYISLNEMNIRLKISDPEAKVLWDFSGKTYKPFCGTDIYENGRESAINYY